jgi:hypothetical protein
MSDAARSVKEYGYPKRRPWKNDGHAWECEYNPFWPKPCTCDRPGLQDQHKEKPNG